jgi:hypothetical protein
MVLVRVSKLTNKEMLSNVIAHHYQQLPNRKQKNVNIFKVWQETV